MKPRSLYIFFFCLFITMALQTGWAQSHNSIVSSAAPVTAKAGGEITLTGEDLGKEAVKKVYLSSATEDFPAVIVSQSADRIVITVPELKPGTYNPSIQVGNTIRIQSIPIRIE
jgi:hypothetical protein